MMQDNEFGQSLAGKQSYGRPAKAVVTWRQTEVIHTELTWIDYHSIIIPPIRVPPITIPPITIPPITIPPITIPPITIPPITIPPINFH